MSRNNEPNPNRVRGPTSALTSFLREQGITIPNRSRRIRREEPEPNPEPQAQEAAQTLAVPVTQRTAKKRKPEADDDPDFNPIASSSRKAAKGRAHILFCTVCKARFVKEQEGQTHCEACKNGTTQKLSKPKRKKVLVKKDPFVFAAVPSLQDTCISIVAKYIDQVDALGVISEDSFEKLSKIICRHRKLNNATSKLFMEPYKRSLTLYDCTNMDADALKNVAHFCPRMETLHLSYCGQIQDEVLALYQARLPQLKHLHLSGGFLITREAWIHFFEHMNTRLQGFGCRHSNRFNLDCVQALVRHCPGLVHLDLGQLSGMDSAWLPALAQLRHLKSLHLAWPSQDPVREEDLLQLLTQVGPQLTELSLRGFKHTSDHVLLQGVMKHGHQLKKLNLELCEALTADAVSTGFSQWSNPGLTHLNLARCFQITDQALAAIVHHSGQTLLHLNIHSLEKLSPQGLELLADHCKLLKELNCGFVRSMDDIVLQKLVLHCQNLQKIFVSGCPLLTDTVKTKQNSILRIVGRETH